jgi:hypothetical protein
MGHSSVMPRIRIAAVVVSIPREARASTPTCAAKSRRELLRSPVTKAQLQGGRQSHPPPMAVALHQTWALGSRLALSDLMQQFGALHTARESEAIDSTGHSVG